MKAYSVKKLAEIISAQVIGNEAEEIASIYFDSRTIVSPKNGVFFAFKGKQKDGKQYIADAYRKGIRIFIAKRKTEDFEDATFLLVDSPLKALQKWATYHRQLFSYETIGITGSNGKTIVKEWLNQLMWQHFDIVRSPKSFNSQIGVPVSVLQMEDHNNLALIEAGISQPGEMETLENIVQPTLGILTNIGSAHSENFDSVQALIFEKLKLFKHVKTLISRADNPLLQQIIEDDESLRNLRKITFGKEENATVRLISIEASKDYSILSVEVDHLAYAISIPFKDEASVTNALICLATLYALGLNIGDFEAEYKHLLPIEMRLEIKEGIQNSLIINDTFNSDLKSVKIALDVLAQQANPRKSLVLTDVLQSNLSDEVLYKEVAELVNSYSFDEIVLIGKKIYRFKDLFQSYVRAFVNTEDFLRTLKIQNVHDEAILLKGARPFQLEKISAFLEKKSHDTVLEVNLTNLIDNVNQFRGLLKPDTKMMCMVKANGYGTGGFEIAHTLELNKMDYLGVAYADEGAEMRRQGITLPIMVMNPEQNSYSTIIDYQLEPEIYSFRVLELFSKTLQEKQITGSYPIHLKIETGMHRLGFHPNEYVRLIEEIKQLPGLHVQSIFTHLATADVPEKFGYVNEQLMVFDKAYEILSKGLGYLPIKHALSSAGITHFPKAQYDMVRLGIGMYGYVESEDIRKHLKIAVYFKTVISQISILQPHETVSYGRRFEAKTESRIATIPVGYADGIDRRLGYGNGKVEINGTLCPIVGTVCMDMMMIDVTGINCLEGDEVNVFGHHYSFIDMAEQLGTIPYEILTSISPRVKRVYIRE